MKWAAVLFSLAAVLQIGQGEAQSSVKCVIRASSRSKKYSKSAFVSLGADIAAELCSPTGTEAAVSIKVEDVAQAFALAVAETSISCKAVGNASASASAYAKAEAQAEATAEALLEGWVSVKTCEGCMASAELFVQSFKSVFASAVAESRTEVEVNAEAQGKDEKKEGSLITKIVNLVVPVKSEIFAKVRTSFEDDSQTCDVIISGCTVAGSEGGCCDLTATTNAQAIEVNAMASAGAGAIATAAKCSAESELEASASVLAKAMARAYAEAMVAIDVHCKTTENSNACLMADVSQDAMAEAQATAFAEAWARADSGCGCTIAVNTTATSIKDIYARATADIFVDVCSNGEGLVDVGAVILAYEEKTVESVAFALTQAVVTGDGCGVITTACTEVGENFACCDLSVDNVASSFSEDAIIEVSVEAGLYTCDGDGEVSVDFTAEALATAWAKVLTQINSYCDSQGQSSACGLAESSISAAATTAATVLVDAWVGTIGECGCELEVDVAVKAMSELLVSITLDVHKDICVAGDGDYHTESELIEAISEGHIEAVANVLASIKQENTECEIELEIDAETKTGGEE